MPTAKVPLNVSLATTIIDQMYEGHSLYKTLKELGIKNSTFHKFLDEYPEVHDKYIRAQKARAELFVEDVVTIADTEIDPQKARNRIDARRWYASKMQPQKYGDRIDLNVNQTVDIGIALAEAQRRALPLRDHSNVIDAEIVDNKQQLLRSATDYKSVDDNKEGKDGDAK